MDQLRTKALALGKLAMAGTLISVSGCMTAPPDEMPSETMLLVGLQDGSIIQQYISVDADICFKENSVSSTTCYTRAAPIWDTVGDTIIGYRMQKTEIELLGK